MATSALAQRLTYDALVRSAKIYLQETPKDYEMAEERLKEAIEKYPDKRPLEAYFALGALLAEKRRYAEMVENFDSAYAICNNASDNDIQKRCDKANVLPGLKSIRLSSWIEEFNSGASTLSGATDIWTDLEDAETEDDTLDILDEIDATYRSALQNFENATIILPDSAQGWINTGITYYNLGKAKKVVGEEEAELALKDSAIISYEKAVTIHPENFDLLSNMASIYFELGDWQKCAEVYGKMASLQPENVTVLSNLSMLLGQLASQDTLNTGYLDDSISLILDQIITLDPENEDALSKRAYFNIGESIDLNDSINVLKKLDEDAYKSEIDSLDNLKKDVYRRVIDDFSVVAEVDSTNYDAWYWMGNCHYFLQENEEALKDYEKAVQIKPDAKESWEILAILYLKLGDSEKSKEAQKEYEALEADSG